MGRIHHLGCHLSVCKCKARMGLCDCVAYCPIGLLKYTYITHTHMIITFNNSIKFTYVTYNTKTGSKYELSQLSF
ncbi:hypothetical protein Hanom_Chr06g00560831 [Helianthus anomalus]